MFFFKGTIIYSTKASSCLNKTKGTFIQLEQRFYINAQKYDGSNNSWCTTNKVNTA